MTMHAWYDRYLQHRFLNCSRGKSAVCCPVFVSYQTMPVFEHFNFPESYLFSIDVSNSNEARVGIYRYFSD
jgi:hypothetical protein